MLSLSYNADFNLIKRNLQQPYCYQHALVERESVSKIRGKNKCHSFLMAGAKDRYCKPVFEFSSLNLTKNPTDTRYQKLGQKNLIISLALIG